MWTGSDGCDVGHYVYVWGVIKRREGNGNKTDPRKYAGLRTSVEVFVLHIALFTRVIKF